MQIVGIGIQDKKDKIEGYVKEKKLEWPVGFDDGDKIAKIYGITYGAGLVFIDRNGTVQGRFLGGFGEEEMEREVAKIL